MFHSTRDLLCSAAPGWTEDTGGCSCSINRETYKYCSSSDATGGSCRGDSIAGSDDFFTVDVVVVVVEVVVFLLWS